MHPRLLLIILLVLSFFSLLLGLKLGVIPIDFTTLMMNLFTDHNTTLHQVIWKIRFPRVIGAFTIGGLLALAGSLMQILLLNPLADPYILGVSSGASLGSLLAMLLGFSSYAITGSAMLGALIVITFVFIIYSRTLQYDTSRLLLMGVTLASGLGAGISFLLCISPSDNLPSMLYWLMGDLTFCRFQTVGVLLLTFGLCSSLCLASKLNVLTQGTIEAMALGVAVKPLQGKLYFLSAIITAGAVTMGGNIGFIGLIVPHITRFLVGHNHYYSLPSSILLGGILLTISDTLARTCFAPQEIPVGIITAWLGVPFFLILLFKQR